MPTDSLFFLTIFSLLSITTSTLRFNEKGEFTILQLTDLHFCHQKDETAEVTFANDEKSQAIQRNALRIAKPDLVVFSGDAVSGRWIQKKPGEWERCWERASKLVVEAGIPYAYILGNHDAEADLSREQIIKLDQEKPLSLRKGAEGIPNTCNFVLPVASSRNENELAANIWLFDSQSETCDTFEGVTWGCVEQSAMDWYDYQSKKIKEQYGTNIHHLAFVHIPLPEFVEMANKEEYYGVRNELVCCPYINTGFFYYIKRNEDISGIFVGHDHENNMGGWHEGIELVYGQKSGYGAYGNERGFRVITLKENYNEKGELNVTRSHYIMFENLTLQSPEPMKRRQKKDPEIECPYYGSQSKGRIRRWFWKLKRWFNSF